MSELEVFKPVEEAEHFLARCLRGDTMTYDEHQRGLLGILDTIRDAKDRIAELEAEGRDWQKNL